MLPRASDKKPSKKAVAAASRPSVGNVSLIGQSTLDLSNTLVNGQTINLDTNAINTINTTPGTAQAGKALVLDSLKNISGVEDVSVSELRVNGEIVTGLIKTGATVSDSAYMNGIQPGISESKKIMSLSADKFASASSVNCSTLAINGGNVTAIEQTKNYNFDKLYQYAELDTVTSVYVRTGATSLIGGTASAENYYKFGKVYLLSQSQSTATGPVDYATVIVPNIYSSAGGAWSLATSANNTMIITPENCYYDETADKHYIPIVRYNAGAATLEFRVLISSSGDVNSLTWTNNLALSCTTSAGLMDRSTFGTMFTPSIKKFAPLNKLVMMLPPTTSTIKHLTGLYASTDGVTWEKLSNAPFTGVFTGMAVTDTHIFVFTTATGNNIAYTTDGVNWTSKATSSAQTLMYQNSHVTYYKDLDMIYCAGKVMRPSQIIAASANFVFGANNQHHPLANNGIISWTYDKANGNYYSFTSNQECFVYNPASGKVVQSPGHYIEGKTLLVDYNNTTFANNKSFRFSFTFTPSTSSESHAVVSPSSFLMFESRTRNVVYDFVWAPAINKYIVLANVNDGFSSGYNANVGVFHSSDLEKFEFVSNMPVANRLEMEYNPNLNALYVYNRTLTDYYMSYDYGKTFSLVSSGVVTSIVYEPLLKSTIFIVGVNKVVINYGVSTNPTSGTDANSFSLNINASVNITYIPRIMTIEGQRTSSGFYFQGHLLGFISGHKVAANPGSRVGFYGQVDIDQSSTGGTYTLFPRFASIISINSQRSLVTKNTSATSEIFSGVIMSNIEYIEPLGVYVAASRTVVSGTATNRIVYSYNRWTWFEPFMNNLTQASVSDGARALRYDRRSGYLFVCGSNGFFRTIHSSKKVVLQDALQLNYNGLTSKWESVPPCPLRDITSLVANDTTCAKGMYLACAQDTIYAGSRYHSATAISLAGNWVSLASAQVFVAVGDDIASSSNGLTWTSRNVTGPWSRVEWSAEVGMFGVAGNGKLAFSSNGTTWNVVTLAGNWKSVKYNNGFWIAVRNGAVAYSEDAVTFSVVSLTGDWQDSTFGGQWLLVGNGVVAKSSKINDPSVWATEVIAGNYNNANYIDNSRAYLLSGSRYAMHSQLRDDYEFYDDTPSTSCRWNYRLQCFVVTTSSGIKHTRFLANGVDSSSAKIEYLLYTQPATNDTKFAIHDNSTATATDQPISINITTANAGMLSLRNNSDNSVATLYNRTDFLTWESANAFNLDANYILLRSNIGFAYPLARNLSKLRYMNHPQMGTTSGDSFVSVDASGKLTTGSVSSSGLIVGSTLICQTPPSSLDSLTAGTVVANKGVALDSQKKITGFNELSITSLNLGSAIISTSEQTTSEIASNGQSSLEGGNFNVMNCAYNKTLDLYAAALDNSSADVLTNIERPYILISKDGLNWQRTYLTGTRANVLRVISVDIGTSLANTFNLNGGIPGFVVILSSSNFVTRALFTPDGVNFFSPLMQTTALAMDSTITTSSIFCEVDASAVSSCIMITNSAAHPNRILRTSTDGLNTTWASTETTNTYRWAAETTANTLWAVTTANNIITHSVGASTSTSTATGETCTAACAAWNLNQTTAFNRIVTTASGKILYGGATTTSTSLTIDATCNFTGCAYNSTTRRFLLCAANGKVYLSAVDSMTSWSLVAVSGFAESWAGCSPAGSRGFILWHNSANGAFTTRKFATVNASGQFALGTSSYATSLGAGCYGNGYYVVPIGSSANSEKIMYSTDGSFWEYSLKVTQSIFKIVFSGSYFVATTDSRVIYTSVDLINWASWTMPNTTAIFKDTVVAPGKVVVFFSVTGATDCVAQTTDGVNWTTSPVPGMTSGVSVASYFNNKFIVSDGGIVVMYSEDLVNFSPCVSLETKAATKLVATRLHRMPSSGAIYAWGSHPGSNYNSWKSTDGVNWSKFIGFINKDSEMQGVHLHMNILVSNYLQATSPDLGELYAFTITPTNGPSVVSIKDEVVKTIGTMPGGCAANEYQMAIYNPIQDSVLFYKTTEGTRKGDQFQLIDLSEYKSKVFKEIPVDYIAKTYDGYSSVESSLATTVQTATIDGGAQFDANEMSKMGTFAQYTTTQTASSDTYIAFGNGVFVGVGGTTTAVTYSYDGINWAAANTGNTTSWNRLRFVPFLSMFIAVSAGKVMYSSNGINWTLITLSAPLATPPWKDITFTNSAVVVVATDRSVMQSTNGTTWTLLSTIPGSATVRCIEYSSTLGRFVVGLSTNIYWSDNGTTWTLASHQNLDAYTVAWSSRLQMFVAGTFSGFLYDTHVSYDGKNWQSADPGIAGQINRIRYSEVFGAFVAMTNGASAVPYFSYDGLIWSVFTTTTIIGGSTSDFVEDPAKKIVMFARVDATVLRSRETPSTLYYGRTYNGRTALSAIWSSTLSRFVVATYSTSSTELYEGNILHSTNGNQWSVSKLQMPCRRICEGNAGRIVVANYTGNTNYLIAFTDDLVTWNSVTVPAAVNIQDICFGNGMYVAVCDSGTNRVLFSSAANNAAVWTVHASALDTMAWTAVTWGNPGGNNLFVALGSTQIGNRLMTSTNGTTWTSRSILDNTQNWISVVWSPTLQIYVAINSGTTTNQCARSTDGINWTVVVLPTTGVAPSSLVWNVDHFVMTVLSATNNRRVWISYDGTYWYPKGTDANLATVYTFARNDTLLQFGADGMSYTKNYHNASGRYEYAPGTVDEIIIANDVLLITRPNTPALSRSTDYAISWSNATTVDLNAVWLALGYSASLGITVALSNSKAMYSSNKGSSWTSGTYPAGVTNTFWKSITFGAGRFIAVANSVNSQKFATSTDGITWTMQARTDALNWNRVLFANSIFVAVGSSGAVSYSSDGVAWTDITVSNVTWLDVVWSSKDSLFIIISAAQIYTSPDGINWTQRTVPSGVTAMQCAAAGPQYAVIFGDRNIVSTNCTSWALLPVVAESSTLKKAIAIDSLNQIIAGGTGGLYSYGNLKPNDLSFSNSRNLGPAPATNAFTHYLTAGNNEILAVSRGSAAQITLARSFDGKFWSIQSINPVTVDITTGIAYGNGICLIIVSTNPRAIYSTDFYNWQTAVTVNTTQTWNRVKFINGKFYLIGSIIATSTDAANWTQVESSANNWRDITYSSSLGLFLVVGTNNIATSSDGTNWTVRTAASALTWTRVEWSPTLNMFVKISTSAIARSTNGTSWTIAPANAAITNMSNVVWDAAKQIFIILTSINDNSVYSFVLSNDGINWVGKFALRKTFSGSGVTLSDIIYYPPLQTTIAGSPSQLLGNTGTIMLDFPLTTLPKDSATFWDVIFSKSFGRFMAIKRANVGTNDTQHLFSLDGYNWTADTGVYTSYNASSRISPIKGYTEIAPIDTYITCRGNSFVQFISPSGRVENTISAVIGGCNGVAFIPGFKVIAFIGPTGYILGALSSQNTPSIVSTINLSLPATVTTFSDIVQCNGRFLMVRSDSTNNYYWSSNLTQWTAGTLPATGIWKFVSENKSGRVIAASSTGTIAYTDDAVNWTTVMTSSKQFVNIRQFPEQGAYVACNFNLTNTLDISKDRGQTWQTVTLASSLRVSDIAYSPIHDIFVIVSGGEDGGSGLSTITVSLPRKVQPGNVLRFNNTDSFTAPNFTLTSKGGIFTWDRFNGTFAGFNVENQPLIALSSSNAYKPSSSAWTIFSDQRIKSNVKDLDDDMCVEIIKNLPLKYYKWVDAYAEAFSIADKHRLGWIAQDVNQTIPTAIVSIGDFKLPDGTVVTDLKTLNSDQILVIMHGAVRALIRRYKELKQTLENDI